MKYVIVWILTVIVAFSVNFHVFAQNDETPEASDYMMQEVVIGSIGAVTIATLAAVSVGWLFCDGWFWLSCEDEEYDAPFYSSLIVGLPVGAVLGVNLIASANDVRGNLFFASIGAVLGEIGGALIGAFIYNIAQNDPEFFDAISPVLMPVLVSVGSGFGAAMGFNIGSAIEPTE
jgi:hypothetical protein